MYQISSSFKPSGDQPQAIDALVRGIEDGTRHQTLLGVTGSGKTFTIANVLQRTQRPALILSHNKTLAAQLYSEFKAFFPDSAVEYFVSYYDYYQPEAYIPSTDTYIEKDLSINQEIEKLRLRTTSSLLSGRRDVIVVSSVSCLYGVGNPEDFTTNTITIRVGQSLPRNKFLHLLSESLYSRNDIEQKNGTFKVKGDVVDIFLAYEDMLCRVNYWGDEIDSIQTLDPYNYSVIQSLESINIYPANIFITTGERRELAFSQIQRDLEARHKELIALDRPLEANRLKIRIENDIEMMKEIGYCSGIENYSRYFDQREPGTRPFCLLDYFPDDYITVIDESHVTIPQIHAMHGGNRSRKENLIEYGFRLPSAMDNRPLHFHEFESMIKQAIYVSATPADYELAKSEGIIVEQLIRPTGLLDPIIEVRPIKHQVDDLIEEIQRVVESQERVLVTTLTKRMAEELTKYLTNLKIRSRYIHSDVDTLERVEIMNDLRKGNFDVLVGVNLLREGLDLPEVSLVAILDADKEGFLRSARSLTQTAGRAARNVNGKVIMYADVVTDSMRKTIDETNRRRAIQEKYNQEHGITPQQIRKGIRGDLGGFGGASESQTDERAAIRSKTDMYLLQEIPQTKPELEKEIARLRKSMKAEAKALNFIGAASLRDQMFRLEKILKSMP